MAERPSAGRVPTEHPLAGLSLADIDALRLVLSGASVIDWKRLGYETAEEVDAFLRLQGFEPDRDEDRARLWALHARAAQYLEMSFGQRLPLAVLQPRSVEDLFLCASGQGETEEERQAACMVLKVMHIVHHLDARELGFLLPLSDRELFALAEERVIGAVEAMRRDGLPIVEAALSRKLKDSLITKLLAKRENIAAQIFDKLRVRVVTARREDLVPVLHHLTRRLFPYNYVIPGESRNGLADLRAALEEVPALAKKLPELQVAAGLDAGDRPRKRPANEFSGASYRDISFVVDLPLRVPDAVWRGLGPAERALGPVVFTLVEFQVLHEAAAIENERGDGSHEMYKRRQLQRVLERLRGVPTEG